MQLKSLTILITGGGSGIGLAFAEALLEKSNCVIICGRSESTLQKAQSQHPKLNIFPADITNRDDVRKLKTHLRQHYGQINVLINNAGIQKAIDFADGQDHWDDIAEELIINLVAQLQLTQQLLPLIVTKHGAIINITSALAIVPKKSAPVYCAAKAGLHNFTRTLRYQLRHSPIRVFEILLALVDTAMTAERPAKGKISPQQLVHDALRGIARNRETIPIERTRLLLALHRLWPTLAYRILQDQ